MLDANEILMASHNQSDTFSPLDYAHVLKFLRRDDRSPDPSLTLTSHLQGHGRDFPAVAAAGFAMIEVVAQ